MTRAIDRRMLNAREVLAAVEHDIRGVAATVGAIGRLLADGRLPKTEEPALFERLTRLAARLETLAADAQTLSNWLDPGVANRVTWLTMPVGPLIESVFGGSGITVPSHDAGVWRQNLVRASDDGALERALGTMRDHAALEGRNGAGWLALPHDAGCDLVNTSSSAPPVEMRVPFVKPRNASLLAALAVLAAHGVSVWRGPDGEDLGLSIPTERPAGQG
jgi:hypothetical protein